MATKTRIAALLGIPPRFAGLLDIAGFWMDTADIGTARWHDDRHKWWVRHDKCNAIIVHGDNKWTLHCSNPVGLTAHWYEDRTNDVRFLADIFEKMEVI